MLCRVALWTQMVKQRIFERKGNPFIYRPQKRVLFHMYAVCFNQPQNVIQKNRFTQSRPTRKLPSRSRKFEVAIKKRKQKPSLASSLNGTRRRIGFHTCFIPKQQKKTIPSWVTHTLITSLPKEVPPLTQATMKTTCKSWRCACF